MAAKPAGEALAANLGIGKVVELARKAQRFRVGRADQRAQPWQDEDLLF